MASETKIKILNKALEMFALNGFKGTNLRDLASSVGITKSALYRYFDSKESLITELLNYIEKYYYSHFGSPNNMPNFPDTLLEFYEMSLRMIEFTISDEKIILARKILLSEQFHYKSIALIATKHFSTDIENIYKNIFTKMKEKRLIKDYDVSMLSFSFVSPVSILIQQADRTPENKEEIMNKIRVFIKHFIDTYGM